MATLNVTIDDTSSLIEYTPEDAWTHSSGGDAQSYVNTTFSRTTVEGATAKFSFEGTGFWLYGATMEDYGEYILIVDDQVSLFANATSSDPQFEQALGGKSGLDDGEHTVVLMAAGRGAVDIDTITFETKDQQQFNATPISVSSQGQSAPTTTQAAIPSSSAGACVSANPNAIGGPDDQATNHSADPTTTDGQPPSQPNAGLNGQPTVQTDGQPVQTDCQPNTTTGNLPNVPNGQPDTQPDGQGGSQTNVQTTAPPSTQPGADDSAPITLTPSNINAQAASTTVSILTPTVSQAERVNDPKIAGSAQADRGLPLGAIVGIAVGAAISVLIIGLVIFFLRRRRAKLARKPNPMTLTSPILPLQDPDVESGYIFGGFGNSGGSNSMRENYLAQPRPPMAQPLGAWVTLQGHASPYAEKNFSGGMRTAVVPVVLRDSSYIDTMTLASVEGDITDMYPKVPPTRPPRPPELRLSV